MGYSPWGHKEWHMTQQLSTIQIFSRKKKTVGRKMVKNSHTSVAAVRNVLKIAPYQECRNKLRRLTSCAPETVAPSALRNNYFPEKNTL